MKRLTSIFLRRTLGVWLCLLLLLFNVSACGTKYTQKYLIPKGYVGWVRVYFGIKNAPALPTENDGRIRVLKIDADGKLLTSSEQSGGDLEWHYYTGETLTPIKRTGLPPLDDAIQNFGSSSAIDCKSNVAGSKIASTTFFSGTEEQYKAAKESANKNNRFRAEYLAADDLKGFDDCGNPLD